MRVIPKHLGSDIELMNFVYGLDRPGGTGDEASRILLAHMPGVMSGRECAGYYGMPPKRPPGAAPEGLSSTSSPAIWTGRAPAGKAAQPPINPLDFGRRWDVNGSCVYIDSQHLEIASCEVSNAFDWVTYFYAQLMQVREAQARADSKLPNNLSVEVHVCNSDGRGTAANSFGSHLNILITRDCRRSIFEQRMHYLLWLASFQSASVILLGLGKVGSERPGAPPVEFQLSQRSDYFYQIMDANTMFDRPMINSRDESHCFPDADYSRFHHIACDSNLMPVANILKAGMWQMILAMVEAESTHVRADVIFESPLDAWQTFSRDPSLTAACRTISGNMLTALDHQRSVFDCAASFHAEGGFDGIVPRAGEILDLWCGTLDMLADRDREKLSRRLDWVLKQMLIEEALEENPDLNYRSPEIGYIDLMYSSLREESGLFWQSLAGGAIDYAIDPEAIEQARTTPPADTRAFTRGQIVRGSLSGVYEIDYANWDSIRIRFPPAPSRGGVSFGFGYGHCVTVFTDTPFGSTAQDNPSLQSDEGIYDLEIEAGRRPDDHFDQEKGHNAMQLQERTIESPAQEETVTSSAPSTAAQQAREVGAQITERRSLIRRSLSPNSQRYLSHTTQRSAQ